MALTYQLIVLLGLSSGLWMGANAACDPGCSQSCPDGWNEHGSRCFQFVNELKDWSDAEEACIGKGGNLASVHNEAELEIVRGLATVNDSPVRVWLGASEFEEGVWFWADGLYFPDPYFGWVSPEPNNQEGPERCMEILHQNADGAIQPLNDAPCNVQKAFICARDVTHGNA